MTAIDQVVTIAEASKLYHVSRGTVRYHCERGTLVWRKVDSERRGLVLIELHSLIQLWGKPHEKIAAS